MAQTNTEAYLESIINNIPHFIFWKDADLVFRGCNLKFAQSAGFDSPNDIIGKTDWDMPWANEAQAFQQDDKNIMATKVPKLNYEEIQTQTNTIKRIMLVSKVPMFEETSKKAIGILGIYTDITEKKLLELKLREINQKLQNILDTLPGFIFWKDINGAYLGANSQLATSAGLETKEDIIGKTDYDLVWEGQADTIRKIDQEVMEAKRLHVVEETARLKDGSMRTFLSNKVPLYDDNDHVTGILGISIDITEHKETLEKLHKAEMKLEGMTAVSSSLAHELRTPLRTILSANSGIKKFLPKLIEAYKIAKEAHLSLPEISSQYLGMLNRACQDIESEAQASFTFINILLTNLKASSSRGLKIERLEPFSIKKSVEEALRRYPFDIGEEELVHCNIEHDFLYQGDLSFVTHILFNLLKNALYQIKAINKGHIEIWTELGTVYNTLHFKDTATGIPSEDLPNIFERFYTKTYHGAGIGLAFCKLAMESIDGEIQCRSKEGAYAEFILYFPNNPQVQTHSELAGNSSS